MLSRTGLALLPVAALVAVVVYSRSPSTPEAVAQPVPPATFTLNKGDHICIIGNTLADRMQHDGWLEAYLHARFPQHNLTIRNLGFSGDEIALRLRSADFGTPDQWLSGNARSPSRATSPTGVWCSRTASRRPARTPT